MLIYQYILVLLDDFSGFRELFLSEVTDARNDVTALLQWFSRLGVVPMTVIDQGPHFKNTVLAELRVRLNTDHHVTTAYVPWANGTVKRANRDILFATRTLLSKLRSQQGDWPSIVPVIQMALNHSPSEQRGGFAPVTLFTGLQANSPLDAIYVERLHGFVDKQPTAEMIETAVEKLRRSLDKMHKKASEHRSG